MNDCFRKKSAQTSIVKRKQLFKIVLNILLMTNCFITLRLKIVVINHNYRIDKFFSCAKHAFRNAIDAKK